MVAADVVERVRATLAAVILLNRELYVYLGRRRGAAFTLASIPLHLLYFVCSGLGFAYAWAGHVLGQRAPSSFP